MESLNIRLFEYKQQYYREIHKRREDLILRLFATL